MRHHLDSYAHFIRTMIPEIITETPPFKYETEDYVFTFSFENFYMHKPTVVEHDGSVTEITPNECRLRNLLYGAASFAQVRKRFETKLTRQVVETTEIVPCGHIPVMVKSVQCALHNATEQELYAANECIYDQGGYFIVSGTERILVGMERMAANQVYVFSNKDPDDMSSEISSIDEHARKSPSRFSVHLSISSTLGRKTLKAVFTNYFKSEFPIGTLFKALGEFGDVKELILKHHLFKKVTGIKRRELEQIVDGIAEESFHMADRDKVLEYLNKIVSTVGSTEDKKENYIDAVLQKEFLPHVGIDEVSYPKKVEFLTYMIQRLLLTYYEQRDCDDHDHCKNKRTDESGILLGNIFKQAWAKMNRELHTLIRRKLGSGNALNNINISQLINGPSLTKDLSYVISTGNWAVIRNSRMKTGVSQVLNRFNFQSALSHSRRIINPMPKNSILSKPRQLHNTSWGTQCPAETPEGHAVGLVKNKALSAYTTIPFNDAIVIEMLMQHGFDGSPDDGWIVMVNGKIIGWSEDDEPYQYLRGLKMDAILPFDMGVYRDDQNKEIQVFTDAGRSCRPLFVVRENKISVTKKHVDDLGTGKITWDDLLKQGIVEMVDVGEQEMLMVCVDSRKLGKDGHTYTHCEISPALLIGVCASIIPFANHDPLARITYQSSMSKQSASIPGTNYQQRMDTMTHVLHYPQKPLCKTKPMGPMHYNDLPAGQNSVLFITTYGGGNQEDAIILSKGSVDRGMFSSSFYRTYKDSETKSSECEERFAVPPKETGTDKLGPNGIVEKGTYVTEGDVLIGKVSNAVGLDGKPVRPRCVKMKHGEHGVVDNVFMSQNPDGSMLCKVRIRQTRRPQVGDKFAAVHSQKGVVGQVINQEDLPFTGDGITPDIIINPHSQPSRMTVGHMIEILHGKNSAVTGKVTDATIFDDRAVEEMGGELGKLGYSRQGWETVYNGKTGEQMEALVYVGVCYYQRLKHMVQDKIHARGSRGPITTLTHQPADGRARSGGLRCGEMERDCLISLGASAVIQQRLFNLSDNYKTFVCEDCGLFAIGNTSTNVYVCKACRSKNVCWIRIPYATKLIFAELYSVGVAPRIMVDKSLDTIE